MKISSSRAERESRRDKLEIIRSVLDLCSHGGALKTKVVYEANLNFNSASMYLDWLIDHDLIAKDDSLYKVTPGGAAILKSLEEVLAILSEDPKVKD